MAGTTNKVSLIFPFSSSKVGGACKEDRHRRLARRAPLPWLPLLAILLPFSPGTAHLTPPAAFEEAHEFASPCGFDLDGSSSCWEEEAILNVQFLQHGLKKGRGPLAGHSEDLLQFEDGTQLGRRIAGSSSASDRASSNNNNNNNSREHRDNTSSPEIFFEKKPADLSRQQGQKEQPPPESRLLQLQGQHEGRQEGGREGRHRDEHHMNHTAFATLQSQSQSANEFWPLIQGVAIASLCILIIVMSYVALRTHHRRKMRREGVVDTNARIDCGGCCPCYVGREPDPQDLELWEVSGEEAFRICPSWIPFPRDLGPRQLTWRVAEINLWIQVFVAGNNIYSSCTMPTLFLSQLQLAFAIFMFVFAIQAALLVARRAIKELLQYFFLSLVVQALYMAAKYATVCGLATACGLKQASFKGCDPTGPLETCLLTSSCLQWQLSQASCGAPGVDTCKAVDRLLPVGRNGLTIFLLDILGVLLFLSGTVPLFMAANARDSKHRTLSEHESDESERAGGEDGEEGEGEGAGERR